VGNGWRDRFDKAQKHAERVMAAWKNDEWFYCGIILSVAIDCLTLDRFAASLWGGVRPVTLGEKLTARTAHPMTPRRNPHARQKPCDHGLFDEVGRAH